MRNDQGCAIDESSRSSIAIIRDNLRDNPTGILILAANPKISRDLDGVSSV